MLFYQDKQILQSQTGGTQFNVVCNSLNVTVVSPVIVRLQQKCGLKKNKSPIFLIKNID